MTWRRSHLVLLVVIGVEVIAAAAVFRWLAAGEAPAAREVTAMPPEPAILAVAPGLPPELVGAVEAWATGHFPGWQVGEPAAADLSLTWERERSARPVAGWVLVPVLSFPSTQQDVALADLRHTWQAEGEAGDGISQIVASEEVAAALDALLGPRGATAPVAIVPASEVVARLEGAAERVVAVVPFHQLEPRLSPLAVDGQSPLEPDLDMAGYPLLVPVWAEGPADDVDALADELMARGLDSNRHREWMTVLAMTGVTALTRGVGLQIDARGDPAWPARGVAGLLAAADITHVSHEVSFMAGCQVQPEMTAFCARPEYLETLRLAGVDVVELTGNHNLDLGPGPARRSLELYAEAGMYVFGGGVDDGMARRPLVAEHNGNRLAFLGYNAFGPEYAWAGGEKPGAAHYTLEALRADLAQVQPHADLIFVNIQYTETYKTRPTARQVADFRAIADSGADVVTGSQAHQPQVIELYEGKPLFYGLGNLFFDQTWSDATCQSLVIRHVIYDGRLLASLIVPTVMDDDCQPWIATPAEREAILGEVFAAGVW